MNPETLPPSPRQADNTPALPAPRMSDQLAEAIGEAAFESRFTPTGRACRSDGWTPQKVRLFLETLAECGVVCEAARAAGMSVQSCYALRKRAEARAFHIAWNAALTIARHRLQDELMTRAMKGCTEKIMKDGEVVGERHRFDNGLALAMLKRLDQQQMLYRDELLDARIVAEEFDEFLDIVCAGGEGAAEFLLERRPSCNPDHCHEVGLLTRLARYIRGKGKA